MKIGSFFFNIFLALFISLRHFRFLNIFVRSNLHEMSQNFIRSIDCLGGYETFLSKFVKLDSFYLIWELEYWKRLEFFLLMVDFS